MSSLLRPFCPTCDPGDPVCDLLTCRRQLPLASLSGVEWDRLRGTATVAISDPKEGRLLIRSTQDVLDQWYKVSPGRDRLPITVMDL